MDHGSQSGQTLLETIVAIFILTMALTTGLGLAIYAINSSSTSQNEIVASGLAREGVEVVRMMRDSNWLASDAKGGPWDLQTCADIASKACFPRSYQKAPPQGGYDLSSGNQQLSFNAAANTWLLSNQPQYDLYVQPDGSFSGNPSGTSEFGRMINISFNSAAPYTNQNSNQEMIVKSVVTWRGKSCTAFNTNTDLLSLSTPCKVIVEEHMTNWKDYK